jgi:hypothetical protein
MEVIEDFQFPFLWFWFVKSPAPVGVHGWVRRLAASLPQDAAAEAAAAER